MRMSQPAATAVLQSMHKAGLNIKEFAVSIEYIDGGIGFCFKNDAFGKEYNFHGLRVVVDGRIDVEDMIIELGEVKGRKGLIFKGENNGSKIDRESNSGSKAGS